MSTYEVIEQNRIEAEDLLKNVSSLAEILKMEFQSDADNILLLRKSVELIVKELGKINQKINRGL